MTDWRAELASAHSLYSAGDYAEADAKYNSTLLLQPNNIEAATGSAFCREALGNHVEALELFRQALEQQPTYGYAWCGLGNSYLALGQFEKALDAYSTCRRQDPSHMGVLLNLAHAYRELGDLESCAAFLARANEASVDSVELSLQEAYLALARNDPQRAELAAHSALAANPNNSPAKAVLIDALAAQGRVQDAESLLDDEGTLTVQKLRIALSAKDDARANRLASELRAQEPSGYASHMIGLADVAAGRLDEAKTEFERALQTGYSASDTHEMLGWVHMRKGDYASAARSYSSALQMRPRDRKLTARLAFALRKSGKLFASIKLLARAIKLGWSAKP